MLKLNITKQGYRSIALATVKSGKALQHASLAAELDWGFTRFTYNLCTPIVCTLLTPVV